MQPNVFKEQCAGRERQNPAPPASSLPRYALYTMLFTVVAALFLPACAKDKVLEIGSRAPEISAYDLTGKTVKLSDYREKVVILRFWITGCKSCVAEMPILDELGKRHQEQGLAVLALNMGDSREKALKFANDLNLSYPVLLDPARITVGKYNIRAAPTTVLIDRRGIARMRIVGEMTRDQFEKSIAALL